MIDSSGSSAVKTPTRKATSSPRIVGGFIRERREALKLSQRALGQMFEPPVTTQFISNVERGVTPLPPSHVQTLAKALKVDEGELMALLQKEYTAKLTERLGKDSIAAASGSDSEAISASSILVDGKDHDFFRRLYDAYRHADEKSREAFATVCDSILKIRK